jgi:hypothetical protein
MSERQQLAQRLADFICQNNLTTPYGGDVVKDGNHYSVLFSTPRVLDGVVKVYGSKFIQIVYTTGYRALPHQGNAVFENETNALDFLNKAFVLLDFDAALTIPTKVKR